jgi:hypothetical protein
MTIAPDEFSSDDEQNFNAFLESIQGFTYGGGGSPPAPPVDGDVTDDEGENEDGDVTDDEQELDDEVVDDAVPSAPTVNAPSPLSSTLRIGDKDIPLDEVTQLYELGKTLRENGLDRQVTQPVPVAPTPETPQEVAPPSFIDPDDEVQMGLWKHIQTLEAKVDQTQQTFQQTAAQQERARAQDDFNSALNKFRTAYPNVTDDDLAIIRPAAALIVNPLIAAHGPVEGMVKAMYITGLDIERTRSKILDPTTPTNNSNTRKRKLNSLNGSSGSAPKTNNRPQLTSDRDVVNAMARELADNLSTNGRIN